MAHRPIRKLETGVAMLAIVAVVILCIVLSHQSKDDIIFNLLKTKESALKSLQDDVEIGERQVSSVNSQLSKMKRDLRDDAQRLQQWANETADPGPEPDWLWSPIKHFHWQTAKDAYDKAKHEILRLRSQKQKLENAILVLEKDLAANYRSLNQAKDRRDATEQIVKHYKELLGFGRWSWNYLIAPLLHYSLLLMLILFVPRTIFRIILINGWTKIYRV